MGVDEQPDIRLAEVLRDSGLIDPGSRGVALVSGGPDSACLAAGLAELMGPDSVLALTINYGLRTDADQDAAKAMELCERLGIECLLDVCMHFDRDLTGVTEGNLQAEAREYRYEAAEMFRADRGLDWIATGHTRTDLAETILYRLASSPGHRAMLGMPPRQGHVVRPLLAIDRVQTRRLATELELPFHDDPSNLDPKFTRVRIREQVLPVLREINPAAEQNLALTWAELDEQADALGELAAEALKAAGAVPGTLAVQADGLADLHPAVRRLALRILAERVAGRDVPLGRERAARIWRLAKEPEGGEVDLGGGLRAVCEAGTIRIAGEPEAEPDPVELPLPGSCRFGRWNLHAELRPGALEPAGPEIATLDAAALASGIYVRAWDDGDRMRPLGLGGAKTLQDLFTDAHVPRSLRRTLPVVESDGRIAWVAGVAVSEEFKISPQTTETAVLTASLQDRF